jgi:cobalt-zinc-cadmium efflux system outer membrane protein
MFDNPALPDVEGLVGAMRRLRPDVRGAMARMQAARAQIDVSRRSVFQGVTLFAGYAFGAGNRPMQAPVESDIMFGLTLPLPLIDHGQGTIPGAQRRAEAADLIAESTVIQAELGLRATYAEVMTRRRALDEYMDAGVTNTTQMLHEAELQYLGGRMGILDLVDAYTALRDARLRLLSLANDLRNAEVNLARMIGVAGETGVVPVPARTPSDRTAVP